MPGIILSLYPSSHMEPDRRSLKQTVTKLLLAPDATRPRFWRFCLETNLHLLPENGLAMQINAHAEYSGQVPDWIRSELLHPLHSRSFFLLLTGEVLDYESSFLRRKRIYSRTDHQSPHPQNPSVRTRTPSKQGTFGCFLRTATNWQHISYGEASQWHVQLHHNTL